MSNKIVVYANGSWEHEHLALEEDLQSKNHLTLTLGNGWPDSQISQMVADFYNENCLSELFDQ